MGIADYNATESENKTVPGSPPIQLGYGVHGPAAHAIQTQAIQRLMADLKNAPLLGTAADARATLDVAPYVANLAALKALDTTKDTVARHDGDHWDFLSGDYSTQVTADTVGAIFAKADAIETTSGAWARRGGYYALGRAKFDWFGVPSDGTTDATSAFETMLTICAALGITRLEAAEKGVYELLDGVVPAASFDIDGKGSTLQGICTAQEAFTSIGDMTGGGGIAEAGDDDLAHTYAESANVAAATGYVGRTFTTPSVVRGAVVVGSSDQGYATGSNPSVTITLYAKTGSAPENGTDGTSLGSITFTDSASETSGRIITSNDKTTLFDHTWVYVSTAAAAGVCIAEFSPNSGSRTILTATSGTSDYSLTFRDAIFDGGWDGSDTTAETSEKLIAIKGYQRLDLIGCTLQNCSKGGASPLEIFTRADMALDIWNVGQTVMDGCVIKDNRRYETVIIKSDDATHVATVRDCLFLNQTTSGSPFSAFNLGNLTWENGVVDGSNAGPNVLCKTYRVTNVHFRDITDGGLDCFESLYYSDSGLVENCSFIDIGDANGERALFVSGNAVVRNNRFENCYLGACAETALVSSPADYGAWTSTTERAISVVFEDNTFDGMNETTSANIRIFGSSSNLATAHIRGADKAATASNPPDRGIWARHIRRMTITGTFYDGVDAMVRHDLGDGTYILDADFNVPAAAHVFHNERASAAACTVTLYWKASNKRIGSLGGSNFDISKGATAESYTAIYVEGANWPTIDTTDIATTVPLYRNGVWNQTTTANTALTITPTNGRVVVQDTATLSADRAITLGTTGVAAGASVRWTCSTSGGFNRTFTVGSTNLATGNWAEFVYNGSAWYRTGTGAI